MFEMYANQISHPCRKFEIIPPFRCTFGEIIIRRCNISIYSLFEIFRITGIEERFSCIVPISNIAPNLTVDYLYAPQISISDINSLHLWLGS